MNQIGPFPINKTHGRCLDDSADESGTSRPIGGKGDSRDRYRKRPEGLSTVSPLRKFYRS